MASLPSQAGIFSMALQSGQLPKDIDFEVEQYQWYRTRAPRIGLGTVNEQENFPPETGGPIVPTGTYKSGQFGGGEVELIPRIENVLGMILYGALGEVTTHTDKVYTQVQAGAGTTTGVNTHVFTFNSASDYTLPWLALRRYTPGRTPSTAFGEVFQDSMVNMFRLDVRAAGLLGATVSFQSIKVGYPSTSAWTYANATEDSTSAPLSNNNGVLTIGGVKYPITQLSLDVQNSLTSPQQERVIGDNHPDSWTPLMRTISARFVVKWENADLYKQILTGSPSGVDWDAIPYIVDTTGSKDAFEATFYAPSVIPGTSTPYMISIRASRVTLAIDKGGIELAAGDIIRVPYQLTFLEPAAGEEYVKVILQNAATYTLPDTPTLAADTTFDYDKSVATPVHITTAATLVSARANLNGGKVVSRIIGFEEGADVLAVTAGGAITVAAGVVSHSALPIGTVTGGSAGADLVINLNTVNATPAAVEALIEAITFNNASATVGTFRTIRTIIWDGAGGFVSAAVEAEIVA